MIDVLRPRLLESARFRLRADGTAGVWDPQTDRALEVAADEAPLLALIDGQRTLSDIADQHAQAHGFVPFAALRDLLRALARAGLLANAPEELASAGLALEAKRLGRFAQIDLMRVASGRAASIGGFVVLIAAGVLAARQPAQDASALDPLWALAGAALALSFRGFGRAVAMGLAGVAPQRMRLALAFGVPHLEPSGGGVVLIDRGGRALVHGAALAATGLGAAALAFHPGLLAGALGVLAADLIPFEPTSMGHLLGALSGTSDLRDHARAYLQKRILTRVSSSHFFPGEGALVAALLLSLGWFTAAIQLLFHWGVIAVLTLVALAIDAPPLDKSIALIGAGVVALCMPAVLLGLVVALGRALFSLRPARESVAGSLTGSALPSAALGTIPIFSHLDAPQLQALAAAAKEVRYAPGARIVAQGEAGDRFFALRSGQVLVEAEQASGLAREVARLGPGDCFGETALLERVPRTATVRALTEVTAVVLTSVAFEEVRKSLGEVDVTRLLRAAAALHKSRFFGRLPSERLSALALRLLPRNLIAGEVVVRAGDSGSELFLVGAGTLEVLDPAGAHVAELRPGDHFGEVALLRDVPRTATVRAKQDALVLALPKDAFIRAMAADLSLSARIEELAAERSEEQPC